METLEEAEVILIYHFIGMAMEAFKTAVGSWNYPEASYLQIGGVPLFTGFMCAAIGGYVTRSWRLFDFRFTRRPPLWTLMTLSAAIYLNFFSDHWGYDFRALQITKAFALLRRSHVYYTVWLKPRSMPMLLAAALATGFIWLAENIGTITNAWLYRHQTRVWSPVGFGKFTSWFLLLIVSCTLVAAKHRPRPRDQITQSSRPDAPSSDRRNKPCWTTMRLRPSLP